MTKVVHTSVSLSVERLETFLRCLAFPLRSISLYFGFNRDFRFESVFLSLRDNFVFLS